jgi:translation initiation factor IF-2
LVQIGGCYVQEGKITRANGIRIIRDGIVVYQGELEALKRYKDDVREVAKGFECGIKIKTITTFK